MLTARRCHVPKSPEAKADAHDCAAPGCPVLCSPGHLACRQHWRAVPQDLRDPLIRAFKARQIDPIGFVLACDTGRRLVREHAHLAAL